MLARVICGFQSGVDQAAARAAKACGLATGGWMPLGWLTEDGPRPQFARLYGAQEHESSDYRARTLANVQEADATVWIGPPGQDGLGFGRTSADARAMGRRFLHVDRGRSVETPAQLAAFIMSWAIETLNVAGSRESKQPGIGQRAERFLVSTFTTLKSFEAEEAQRISQLQEVS